MALRRGALGVAFKRQVVLGERYVVDFFVPSVGLVVEVDGKVHRGSADADGRRDEKLRRLGYRVVRIEAALVMRDGAAALALVGAALKWSHLRHRHLAARMVLNYWENHVAFATSIRVAKGPRRRPFARLRRSPSRIPHPALRVPRPA